MKKLITIIIMIAMLSLVVVPMSVTSVSAAEIAAPAEDSIAISTVEEFKTIEKGKNYHLTADIDFRGETVCWVVDKFAGILDGQGHSILGLDIKTDPTKEQDCALIRRIDGNTVVKNLTMGTAQFPITLELTGYVGKSFGPLAGALTDGFTLDVLNCEFFSEIKAHDLGYATPDANGETKLNTSSIGGVIGYGRQITFTDTKVHINTEIITVAKCNVGGYIGNSNKPATFTNCTVDGTAVVGVGPTGVTETSYTGSTMTYTYAEVYQNNGGFIGAASSGNHIFVNCESNVNLTNYCTTVEARAAGFVAYSNVIMSFENCTFNGSVSVLNDSTGQVAAAAQASGFLGHNNGSNLVYFEDCNNRGNVTSGQWVSAFVANYAGSVYLEYCNNYGTLALTELTTELAKLDVFAANPANATASFEVLFSSDMTVPGATTAVRPAEVDPSDTTTGAGDSGTTATPDDDDTTTPSGSAGNDDTTVAPSGNSSTTAPTTTAGNDDDGKCGGITIAAQLVALLCGTAAFIIVKKK